VGCMLCSVLTSLLGAPPGLLLLLRCCCCCCGLPPDKLLTSRSSRPLGSFHTCREGGQQRQRSQTSHLRSCLHTGAHTFMICTS
jgi:hypothetical protein